MKIGIATCIGVFGIYGLAVSGAGAQGLDQISFGTNWVAEAEHGGFYQALADGTYEAYGLDVTIVPGGPQTSNRQLMLAGKIQFFMAGNLMEPFYSIEQDIPLVEVAAFFQKEPQVFLTHPEMGIKTFDDLAEVETLFMSRDIYATAFQWMKSAFDGFMDEQYKPYTFSPAPFMADKNSAQQGYITSEPFAIEREGGFKPDVLVLADAGFDTYSTLIESTDAFVEANPDVVQRFIDASIIGWYNYLYGDNSAANDLIKTHNPEMTDAQIAFSVETMKAYGIVDSGDALDMGIGCMTDARMQSFYEKMAAAGVLPDGLDISTVYTTEFVCKGVGLDLKP